MTTKVTVDAHAGWPIEVTIVDLGGDGAPVGHSKEIVAAYAVRDFYAHSHRELHIRELPNRQQTSAAAA